MSSLKNLRNRFTKTDRDDRMRETKDSAKNRQSPVPSEEDIFEVIEPALTSEEVKHNMAAHLLADDTLSCRSAQSEESSVVRATYPDEHAIFEEQLNQLQDQLMMVMIENQTLKSELHSSKANQELEQVKAELSYERHRCDLLEKRLEKEQHKKGQQQKLARPDPETAGKSKQSGPVGALVEGEDQTDTVPVILPKKKRLYQRLGEFLLQYLYSFLDDFTEEPPETVVGDPEGEPLSVKTLKENMKRFGAEAKPYVNTVKGIWDLLAWKSPPYTLIVFVVYMYSLWQGWLLPMLLFALAFRLFINYLRHRGWNINFNFFDTAEETKEPEEKDMGMSDKFNLVMQVARKVQNLLGEVADSLEKIKSLLTWRHPEASRQLLLTITAAFTVSCILPTPLLFFYSGLAFGVKLFIVDYVYNRFPRVRRKYDSSWRLWLELPTDHEFEKKNAKSEIDKYILPQDKAEAAPEARCDLLTLDDRTFCELFALPESECPLPGWQGGRRCTLINREKSLTAAFKNGRLYLTHSFLCFERTKVPSPKNIVIPLTDIARLEKAKPYGWMPGGGMAIEIAVVGNDKPYIFGAILNRDEVFEGILLAGRKAGLSWSAASRCPSPSE